MTDGMTDQPLPGKPSDPVQPASPRGAEAGTAALISHLVGAGYVRAEPPILQPASVFLDMAGEELRGRLLLTGDAGVSDQFCLRPEYTIPLCRAYLASGASGLPASFSYLGPVFRQRRVTDGQRASSEFIQAGLESYGRKDIEAADADILGVALEAVAKAGQPAPALYLGDAGLFARMLDVLDIPAPWQRRIRNGHARGMTLEAILSQPERGMASEHAGVLAALAGTDREGAKALVRDLLAIAGIAPVGGRSTSEIADRFLEQAATRPGQGLEADKRAILGKFLAIKGHPDSASASLHALAAEADLPLNDDLASFDLRLNYCAARGIDLDAVVFEAGLSRNLDYYTGFVFEARDGVGHAGKVLAAGGRYDRLFRTLGAAEDIPAVGAAIWIDRLDAHNTEACI